MQAECFTAGGIVFRCPSVASETSGIRPLPSDPCRFHWHLSLGQQPHTQTPLTLSISARASAWKATPTSRG